MAKKTFNIDDLFDEPTAAPVKVAPEHEEQPLTTEPAAVNAQPVAAVENVHKQANKQTSKQANNISIPKSNHTFEIPDDVWADFNLLLFIKQSRGAKTTKNAFITDLLRAAIEENKDLIARFKNI